MQILYLISQYTCRNVGHNALFCCCFSLSFPWLGKAQHQRTGRARAEPCGSPLRSNRRQVGWYLNGPCLFFFWSRVCMWAQYKGPGPFEGDSTRKVRGKETLLWCFIYQRNDFPQIKTCSILPLGLEQAARFLSWKLSVCLNNAPGQERGRCHVLKIWCGAFVWPQVQPESCVYSICDIWMNRHNCGIWININAGTIDSGFWTVTWNKSQRWKYFLRGCEVSLNSLFSLK